MPPARKRRATSSPDIWNGPASQAPKAFGPAAKTQEGGSMKVSKRSVVLALPGCVVLTEEDRKNLEAACRAAQDAN